MYTFKIKGKHKLSVRVFFISYLSRILLQDYKTTRLQRTSTSVTDSLKSHRFKVKKLFQ